MRTDLNIQEVKYSIDEKRKVVVCKIKADPKIKIEVPYKVYNKLEKKFKNFRDNIILSVGVAICDSCDDFDITLGKRIAESKAKRRAFKITAQLHEEIYKEYEKMLREERTLADNCSLAAGREYDHIDYLLGRV